MDVYKSVADMLLDKYAKDNPNAFGSDKEIYKVFVWRRYNDDEMAEYGFLSTDMLLEDNEDDAIFFDKCEAEHQAYLWKEKYIESHYGSVIGDTKVVKFKMTFEE